MHRESLHEVTDDVNAGPIPIENEKGSGWQVANRRVSAASRYGHTAPERRRHSVIKQGGKMSRIIITMSRTIFFRLLAHSPVDLQREAKEDARRAIPAFCFTEDDISERFAQEEQWDELSEYDRAAKLANEAINEAVGRYLHEVTLEKEAPPTENETM
jgi:hypothetical protein